MDISNNIYSNIFDLPDELLFIIINKLNINDAIYSLMDINERFVQLIFDPLYIQNLDITTMTMNSYYDRIFSVHEQVLSRLCQNILPKVHDQVKKLVIEQHSIEHILTFNYSQLYSLSLVNFKEEILFQYLTGIVLIFHFFTFINKINSDLQIQIFVILLNKSHI